MLPLLYSPSSLLCCLFDIFATEGCCYYLSTFVADIINLRSLRSGHRVRKYLCLPARTVFGLCSLFLFVCLLTHYAALTTESPAVSSSDVHIDHGASAVLTPSCLMVLFNWKGRCQLDQILHSLFGVHYLECGGHQLERSTVQL